MALSTPFVGSGRFVPERKWSCPVHDRNVNWSDECDPWLDEGEICLDCEMGQWVDVKDEHGNVVLRELGLMEEWLLEAQAFMPPPLLVNALIQWKEDENLSKIVWNEG